MSGPPAHPTVVVGCLLWVAAGASPDCRSPCCCRHDAGGSSSAPLADRRGSNHGSRWCGTARGQQASNVGLQGWQRLPAFAASSRLRATVLSACSLDLLPAIACRSVTPCPLPLARVCTVQKTLLKYFSCLVHRNSETAQEKVEKCRTETSQAEGAAEAQSTKR